MGGRGVRKFSEAMRVFLRSEPLRVDVQNSRSETSGWTRRHDLTGGQVKKDPPPEQLEPASQDLRAMFIYLFFSTTSCLAQVSSSLVERLDLGSGDGRPSRTTVPSRLWSGRIKGERVLEVNVGGGRPRAAAEPGNVDAVRKRGQEGAGMCPSEFHGGSSKTLGVKSAT